MAVLILCKCGSIICALAFRYLPFAVAVFRDISAYTLSLSSFHSLQYSYMATEPDPNNTCVLPKSDRWLVSKRYSTSAFVKKSTGSFKSLKDEC